MHNVFKIEIIEIQQYRVETSQKRDELSKEKSNFQTKTQELNNWENNLKDYAQELESKEFQLVNKEAQMKDLLESFDAPIRHRPHMSPTNSVSFVYNSIDDDTRFHR